MKTERGMFLISEYCPGPFYMGWHLYLRESKARQQRNADGTWGWLRRSSCVADAAHRFLVTIGITIKGDGSCDYDGYADIARRFPIPRQRIGGKPRGCIPVVVDEWGDIRMGEVAEPSMQAAAPAPQQAADATKG